MTEIRGRDKIELRMKKLILFSLFFFLSLPLGFADEVWLKGGKVIEGVIEKVSEEGVSLRMEWGGVVDFPLEEVVKVKYTKTGKEDDLKEFRIKKGEKIKKRRNLPPPLKPKKTFSSSGPQAKIIHLRGEVLVKRRGKIEWEKAEKGKRLWEGDELRTEVGSEVVISYPDGSLSVVEELSTLKIENLREGTRLKFWKGKLFNLVERAKIRLFGFRIDTPAVVIAVRGTSFKVKTSDILSRVAVFEGEVELTGREGTKISLKGGEQVTVIFNLPPGPKGPLRDFDLMDWERWKNNLKSLTPLVGKDIVGGMAENIALTYQRHEKIVREWMKLKIREKASRDLEELKIAIGEYTQDVGDYPPSEYGLKALLVNVGVRGWNGPYISPQSNLLDPWGEEYIYELKRSKRSGNLYVELRSRGPNRRDDRGRGDDIRCIFVKRSF